MHGNTDTRIRQSQASNDQVNKGPDQQIWADRLVIHVSNTTAWLFPILVIAITTQVVLRKMGYNQAWLDDLQWWI